MACCDCLTSRRDKRKRSSSPRAASEEGEIAEPANDADLDYLRAKKQRTAAGAAAQDGALTTKTGALPSPPPPQPPLLSHKLDS